MKTEKSLAYNGYSNSSEAHRRNRNKKEMYDILLSTSSPISPSFQTDLTIIFKVFSQKNKTEILTNWE